MPFKICPKCKQSNGPRTHICACGHSFLPKQKISKIKVVKNKGSAEPVENTLVGLDSPLEFLPKFILGLSTAFSFRKEEIKNGAFVDENGQDKPIQLVDSIRACRESLKEEDVKKCTKMSIKDLWELMKNG